MERYPPAREYGTRETALFEGAAIFAAWADIGPYIHIDLIIADFSVTPDTVIGDLVIATSDTWDNYSFGQISPEAMEGSAQWEANGSVRYSPNGSAVGNQWQGPSETGPVTIYGYVYRQDDFIRRIFRLEQPVTLSSDTDYFQIMITTTFPGGRIP